MDILKINGKNASDFSKASAFIDEAVICAGESTCARKRCGSVIVSGGIIIGKGHNSPPGDIESQRRCTCEKDSYNKRVTDKTCCIHAEQRAIMDALKRNPDKIKGSRLYFARLDSEGKKAISGDPYCTICSKMALDSGIAEFVLLREEGIVIYDTQEYNDISYGYKG